jgi:hypothetical protein
MRISQKAPNLTFSTVLSEIYNEIAGLTGTDDGKVMTSGKAGGLKKCEPLKAVVKPWTT